MYGDSALTNWAPIQGQTSFHYFIFLSKMPLIFRRTVVLAALFDASDLKVKLQAHLGWREEEKRLLCSNHTLILRYILISGYPNYILKSSKMVIFIFFWIYSKYLVAKSSGFLRENIIFSVTVVFVLYVLFYSQCVRIQPSIWNRLIWSYHHQTFLSHLEEDTDTRRNYEYTLETGLKCF